jgi:nitroimidazol reductase NimA-like FMN-containing flavoprotein (pyridoxamine 5'-phosphate oxidase superfamily)
MLFGSSVERNDSGTSPASVDMFIREMTEAECLDILSRTRLGRLACAHDNQPYVVPIYFKYEQPCLYAFTTPGQKVEWMRSNPLVCLEVDDVQDSKNWASIVVFGRFEELKDLPAWKGSSLHTLELLNKNADWWEPGYGSSRLHHQAQPVTPLFFRIHIDQISGRRASHTHFLAARRKGWLQGIAHGLTRLFASPAKYDDDSI